MDERLAFLRAESPSSLPLPCSFTHRAPGASGEAELNYWPSRRGSIQAPHHLMLFILGNPGLLGYYPPFLNHLHSLLPPSYALLATSHIGHSTRIASPKEPLDLPQQLESKIELVKSLTKYLDGWAKENGRSHHALPKISLMGHSVGAWLSCEIMKKLNTDPQPENWPIQRGFFVVPDPRVDQQYMEWMDIMVKPLLPLLSPLLRPLLPYISLPPTSLSLVRSPEVIKHVLHLSKSEMQLIRDPDIDWHRSQNIEDKQQGLFGVWAGGNLDGWVGKDGPLVQEALGGLGGGRVKTLEGVPHAFCLTQANSEAVAEAVASWINSIPQDTNVTPGSEPKNEPLGGTVIPM